MADILFAASWPARTPTDPVGRPTGRTPLAAAGSTHRGTGTSSECLDQLDDGARRTAKPRDRRHTKIGHDKSPPGQETESRLGVRCFGTQSRAGWATGPMTLLGAR